MQAQALFTPSGFGTNDVQIMAGNFDEFSFDDVIQVVGLSRQCLRLMIRRGGATYSEVLLKAGQVLEARMPSSSEPESVFRSLFGFAVKGSGLSFSIYHTEPTGPFPAPRATLVELVERARQAAVPAPAAPAGPEATLRLSPQALAAAMPSGPPTPQAAAAASASPTPEAMSRALAAELRPLVREELLALLAQSQQQGQTLAQMDGRLLALPQLVAAEIRAALAHHDRQAAAAREPQAPARPAEPGRWPMALMGLGLALLAALLAVAVVIAVR